MKKLVQFFERVWYDFHPIRWVLWPISWIYCLVTVIRRHYLMHFHHAAADVPVIVVGNITVGGVGKTPLVIAIANALTAKGVRVGIVSRGFGATANRFPLEVQCDDNALWVGDEPLLLARKTKCPVVISPKRRSAVAYLVKKYQSQVIISDDGLQHYAMKRVIEIAVFDGVRGIGNGMCLPAGPLRERVSRLKRVDFIVINGESALAEVVGFDCVYQMNLVPGAVTNLLRGTPLLERSTTPMAAVAAIGHPERFFTTLRALNIPFHPYPFPDHYRFKPETLVQFKEKIVMTEKDAVKCLPFATDAMYFLPVEALLSTRFWEQLWSHEKLNPFLITIHRASVSPFEQ